MYFYLKDVLKWQKRKPDVKKLLSAAGFFCQLDGSAEYHMDTEELSAAEWIPRDQIPARGSDISLTGEMIEAFRTKTYPQYEAWEGKK